MTNADLPLDIDCLAVKQMRDDGVDHLLIDVRTPGEHEIVRLEGATLLPMQEIAARLEELTPHRERRIVVHCHHGGRSERVTMWLRSRGSPKHKTWPAGLTLGRSRLIRRCRGIEDTSPKRKQGMSRGWLLAYASG